MHNRMLQKCLFPSAGRGILHFKTNVLSFVSTCILRNNIQSMADRDENNTLHMKKPSNSVWFWHRYLCHHSPASKNVANLKRRAHEISSHFPSENPQQSAYAKVWEVMNKKWGIFPKANSLQTGGSSCQVTSSHRGVGEQREVTFRRRICQKLKAKSNNSLFFTKVS